jgi:hypothetical protein
MPSHDGASGVHVLDASSYALPDLDAAPPLAVDAALQPEDSALDRGSDASETDAAVAGEPPLASLVIPERWLLVNAAADPYDDRPPAVDCPSAAVGAETLSDERVFGVETGWCSYLTATQPTLRAVAAGETIKVRLWHFELSAPEPSEAHASVLIDGLRVLDLRLPIPQAGGLIVQKTVAERAVPAGAPIYFHLHNHGQNSWALVEVSVGPATPN